MTGQITRPHTDAQPGRIVLARHGKSALSRCVWLSAAQYRDWWARYDQLGLDAASAPAPRFIAAAADADRIWSSTLPRSRETAAIAAKGRPVLADALFIEAPLPPPRWPGWLKLKPRFWGAIARIHWLWGGHGSQESAAAARARASEATDRLMAEVADSKTVFLAAHGWFNRMIGQELSRRGWRCVEDGGYRHWSVRVFEKRG